MYTSYIVKRPFPLPFHTLLARFLPGIVLVTASDVHSVLQDTSIFVLSALYTERANDARCRELVMNFQLCFTSLPIWHFAPVVLLLADWLYHGRPDVNRSHTLAHFETRRLSTNEWRMSIIRHTRRKVLNARFEFCFSFISVKSCFGIRDASSIKPRGSKRT